MSAKVRLRPVAEDDLPLLTALLTEPDLAGFNWTGWSDPHALRRRWAEDGLLGEDDGKLLVLHGEDRIGLVSWSRVQTGRRGSYCWTIGVGLLPEARGRGLGTEAQRQLVRYLFGYTSVHRIQADTEVDNIAEQRALEKAGFTREGVLRGYAFLRGRWRDAVVYGILRDEVDLD